MELVPWFPNLSPRRWTASARPRTLEPRSRWQEDDDSYVLVSQLAGFRRSDVAAVLEGDLLKLSARYSGGWLGGETGFYDEVVRLPEGAASETLEAHFADGQLIVRVYKRRATPARRIAIVHRPSRPLRDGLWSRLREFWRQLAATFRGDR